MTPLPSELGSRLQGELTRWIGQRFFPGVTAAVVTPQGAWTGAAGVDGDGVSLHAESGMALASITKTFTAAEVMTLAERGKIDLDQPASSYLSVPEVSNGVTVRQLLGHRSAIHDAGEEAYPDLFDKPNAHWGPQQVLDEVPTPTQSPGQSWTYANANFVVLGMLIQKVADLDPAAAIRRDLWKPLGLSRLAYQDAQALPPPLAAPGGDDELPSTGTAAPYLPYRSLASAAGAAGGISGDALSVARWGYDLYGAELLDPKSVTQMTDFKDGDGYGLGTFDYTNDHWFTSNVDGFGHHGVIPGYRTVLAVYPDMALSIAILTPSNVEPLPYVRYLAKAVAQTGK
jgi:D-alanyl-D-alanine carboxypeptidase